MPPPSPRLSDVQTLKYRQAMDTYLSMPSLAARHPTTLNQLYPSDKFLVIPSQYSTSSPHSPLPLANASYPISKSLSQDLTTALRNTFTSHALDAVIYPSKEPRRENRLPFPIRAERHPGRPNRSSSRHRTSWLRRTLQRMRPSASRSVWRSLGRRGVRGSTI